MKKEKLYQHIERRVHMFEYAETAKERGIKVIIAGAGGAAHPPGMIAAKTILPCNRCTS